MSDLFTAPFEDRAIAAYWDDAAWIAALVRVEVALAHAQAKVGVIPPAAAETIARRVEGFSPDFERLRDATARDAFPVIGLLDQLRAQVGGDAAGFIHWGATTQDIVDTALITQLAAVLASLEQGIVAVSAALGRLADSHRATLMIGRTHLQPALPITFGLKAASWLAPMVRHRQRLRELRPRLLVVQCGGASGTLASLGGKGRAVAHELAQRLGLGEASTPWQAQRDSILEAAGWLTLVTGSVAKFAQDVLLLTQAEIGEVRESTHAGGGSSAMPQKSNPVCCEKILVAARLVAAHHAGLLGAPPPEHERGTQAGQLELVHLPRMCALTGGALHAAGELARGLVVDAPRMRTNLDATHGVLLAEAAALALARHMDRQAARQLVSEACATARREERHLLEILRALPEAKAAVNGLPKDEADYLGSAGDFIDRVLADSASLPP